MQILRTLMALATLMPVSAATEVELDIQLSNSPADASVTAGGGAVTIDLTFWSINSRFEIAVKEVTVVCTTADAYGSRRSPGLTVSFKDPTTGSWSSGRTAATGFFPVRLASPVKVRFGPYSPLPDKFTLPVRLEFSSEAWNGTWRLDGRISDFTASNELGESLGRPLVQQGGGTVMQLGGGTEKPRRSLPPANPGNAKPQSPAAASVPPSPPAPSPTPPEPTPSILEVAEPPVTTGATQQSATSDLFASVAVLLLLAAGGYALYSRRRR